MQYPSPHIYATIPYRNNKSSRMKYNLEKIDLDIRSVNEELIPVLSMNRHIDNVQELHRHNYFLFENELYLKMDMEFPNTTNNNSSHYQAQKISYIFNNYNKFQLDCKKFSIHESISHLIYKSIENADKKLVKLNEDYIETPTHSIRDSVDFFASNCLINNDELYIKTDIPMLLLNGNYLSFSSINRFSPVPEKREAYSLSPVFNFNEIDQLKSYLNEYETSTIKEEILSSLEMSNIHVHYPTFLQADTMLSNYQLLAYNFYNRLHKNSVIFDLHKDIGALYFDIRNYLNNAHNENRELSDKELLNFIQKYEEIKDFLYDVNLENNHNMLPLEPLNSLYTKIMNIESHILMSGNINDLKICF